MYVLCCVSRKDVRTYSTYIQYVFCMNCEYCYASYCRCAELFVKYFEVLEQTDRRLEAERQDLIGEGDEEALQEFEDEEALYLEVSQSVSQSVRLSTVYHDLLLWVWT